MEDKNFRKGYQKIIYTESMRELGAARFVLGGVILLFGLFFIWIELYIVGIPIADICNHSYGALFRNHYRQGKHGADKKNRLD